jgi:hypothetical protein
LEGNGIFGKDPDLVDLDSVGNLKHDTDFRSIYATILESWLCIDASHVDNILGDVYERIPGLGLNCLPVYTSEPVFTQQIQHKLRSHADGSYTIEYEISRPGQIDVEVYTIMGQKITTLVHEYQDRGQHQAVFINQHMGLSSSMYIYVIRSGSASVSGKFLVR